MLFEPGRVPTYRKYSCAPLPADQVNVATPPRMVEPGTGLIIEAFAIGACVGGGGGAVGVGVGGGGVGVGGGGVGVGCGFETPPPPPVPSSTSPNGVTQYQP